MLKNSNIADSDKDLKDHFISGQFSRRSLSVYVSDILMFYWVNFEPEKDILNHDKDI